MSQIQPADQSGAYLSPSQLCIGLYVHLDLPWTDHPFTFSSFKIKTLDQICTIQGLGLQHIRYSPSRSDCQPLTASEQDVAQGVQVSNAGGDRNNDAAFLAKRERLDRLAAQRAKVQACERELLNSARAVRSVQQNLFSRPDLARKQADTLVNQVADSMLLDADIAIHLMADKVGGEDVYDHGLNVMLLAMMLARELKMPSNDIRALGMGALFRDIGECDLPERLRRRGEVLSKPETSAMQQHCLAGVERAKPFGLSPESLLVIAQHHEQVDGSGFPKRLKGPQISLSARIVAVTCAYDVLCNPHDPSKAATPHEALSVMYGQQRNRFDNLALTTFVRCMGIYPPGTLVVLSNGAVGLVTSVNGSRPLKPTVLVYDPAVPKEEAMLVDLEREPDVMVTKTMRPDQLSAEMRNYLAPRKRTTYFFEAEARKSP